jgi:hypothetical protein
VKKRFRAQLPEHWMQDSDPSPINLDRGFRVVDDALRDWEGLFEEWTLLVERYCRLVPGEAPYWHTERANVGLLAGAAWRCGWLALEEFHSTKGDKSETWRGRLDLALHTPTHGYAIEAKQGWPYLGDASAESTVRATLHEAGAAARLVIPTRSVGTKSHAAVAVAFCAPYVNAARQVDVAPLAHQLLTALSTASFGAIVWCFPLRTRDLRDVKRDIHPGVILVAQVVEMVSGASNRTTA